MGLIFGDPKRLEHPVDLATIMQIWKLFLSSSSKEPIQTNSEYRNRRILLVLKPLESLFRFFKRRRKIAKVDEIERLRRIVDAELEKVERNERISQWLQEGISFKTACVNQELTSTERISLMENVLSIDEIGLKETGRLCPHEHVHESIQISCKEPSARVATFDQECMHLIESCDPTEREGASCIRIMV